MTCRMVQNSLSAHVDDLLPSDSRRAVQAHLAQCGECTVAYEQLLGVRRALQELPALSPPEQLSADLLVMASLERQRRLNRRSPAAMLAHLGERARLWMDNLMRPVALPFAGGVISALLLFAILVPNIAFSRIHGARDVPTSLFTEAAVKSQAPFGFPEDDFVVEVLVDGQGRMMDYSVTDGQPFGQDLQLRRSIENNLLFTEFHPATAFGRPTWSKLFVSFNRSRITIKS